MDIFVAKIINLHLKKKYLLFKILNSYKNAKFLIKKKYQCENIAYVTILQGQTLQLYPYLHNCSLQIGQSMH